MAIDLAKLAGQGRAYSSARAWTPEELDALLLLERDRGIGRMAAADFIRNGVMTPEDYDAALAAAFVPKTLDQAADEAAVALKDNGQAAIKKGKKADKPDHEVTNPTT